MDMRNLHTHAHTHTHTHTHTLTLSLLLLDKALSDEVPLYGPNVGLSSNYNE